MSERQDAHSQVRRITRMLVDTSFAIRYNFPFYNSGTQELVWERYQNLAFSLKDEKYEDIYEALRANGDYNFLMLDGAIIQMAYKFRHNNITEHILRFFPHPHLESFQDNPESFEELYYDGTTFFAELYDKKAVASPIRIDYTSVHQIIDHPRCHVTIGNYSNCRIPVVKPISPLNFIHFILRNFYYDRFKAHLLNEDFTCNLRIRNTIHEQERNILHLNIGD